MRSVPEMVSAKLWRAPVRTSSTPKRSTTLAAMVAMVSAAVTQRLRSDLRARRRTIMGRSAGDHGGVIGRFAGRGRAVLGGDIGEAHDAVEAGGEALVVADHDEG